MTAFLFIALASLLSNIDAEPFALTECQPGVR